MGSYNNTGVLALWEYYLIYLRKSRQDDPNETVEEVLEKHETMLQEFALKEFGGRIPEENIYREVVSGESIDDRERCKRYWRGSKTRTSEVCSSLSRNV